MISAERPTSPTARSNSDTVVALRSALDRLHALDETSARFVDALAFILMRVAEADRRVTDDEIQRMEEVLAHHQSLPIDHAMLAVEIARHRLRHADAASSYIVSRHLRHHLCDAERIRLLPLLTAVAEADGRRCDDERATIDQISWELGFDRTRTAC